MLCAAAPRLEAQAPAELNKLATLTAQRVAKLGKEPILVAPLDGCLLDSAMCTVSVSLLRAELEKQNPNVKFIDRDALDAELSSRHLLAIDACHWLLVEDLAHEMGAQVLVMENLYWNNKHKHYVLSNSIIDPTTGKRIVLLKTTVNPAVKGDDPVVFRDPASGVSLIVINKKDSGFRVFRFPSCEDCSVPAKNEGPVKLPYPEEYLAATITETGTVRSAGCFRDDSGCEEALRIVRSWHFKPAIDSNGKRFAVRAILYVNLDESGRADPGSIPPWRNDSW